MNALNLLPIIPGRKDPADQSEMVTQILFGERIEILDTKDGWCLIKNLEDDYTCWVDQKQLTFVSDDEFEHWNNYNKIFNSINLLNVLTNKGALHLSYGALIPDVESITIASQTYHFNVREFHNTWPNFVLSWLNTPYLWGGKSLFGVDCSGFVQVCFAQLGIFLPRDAYQQAEKGETINTPANWKQGDIAFFSKKNKITHVGILWGQNKIIHASGHVRMDNFSEIGIIHSDTLETTHSLYCVKRIYEFDS